MRAAAISPILACWLPGRSEQFQFVYWQQLFNRRRPANASKFENALAEFDWPMHASAGGLKATRVVSNGAASVSSAGPGMHA